ncbi:MAG: LptF/LptG family permease [Thermodesulfovibrionales bacterium]|nr:LptF/LptG family permease [Thermodesulfovibrionales bacterium]
MKLLHRLIYREIFFHLLIGILAINTIIMVEKLIRVSKVLSGIAGPSDMARIILLIQPQMLVITIPVAFLIAILLVFGRMNMDNELIAAASSGISLREISLPVLKTGVLLLVFTLFVSTTLAPLGNRRLRMEINSLLKKGISKKIEEKTFTDLGEMVIYTDKRNGKLLEDVFIYLKNKNGVLTAKRAFIRTEGTNVLMELYDGLISIVRDSKKTDIYFGKYTLSGIFSIRGLSKKPGELMPHQLLEEAGKAEKKKSLSYMSEFYRRFTYPFFNILIALTGPGLSLLAGRTGRFGGLAIGLLFFVVYYMLTVYSEGLVEAGKLSPLGGSLLPVVAGLVTGIVVYMRSLKR